MNDSIPSSGNVFVDLGFSPEEAALMTMRAQLMTDLRGLLSDRGWTQAQAAAALGVSQSRISDLVRGKVRVHGVPRNAGRRMPMRDGFRLEVVVAS
jgi:predicted XRE-type DNA-binding protein